MKYLHLFIAFALSLLFFNKAFAQIQQSSIPLSATENLPPVSFFEEMPLQDSAFLKNKQDSAHIIAKHFQFAYAIETGFNPQNSGKWSDTPNGKVWRLGIYSKGAYSLYLHLQYALSPSTKVYVYAPGYEGLQGSFTNENNNPAEVLAIAPVRGERLIVELNIPHRQKSHGKIEVVKVFHDYLNLFQTQDTEKNKPLNDCYQDINCSNGKYWQTEKRSVCKILSNGGMGTGTLVGNTSGSSTAHVLTANHLISSEEVAATALFLFNFETTGCDGEVTTIEQSVSGATILSTSSNVDFTLLQLYEQPPPSYQPFYAGWDAQNNIAKKGVCVHHPYGGPKQIAIEYHSLKDEDLVKRYDSNSTWKVSHWEVGTTELGSSGGPLFDQGHRLIGTLTGGRSTCGYTYDDFFTKFGVSWDAYPAPSNQLKYWLDPGQTGQLVLDGYDPYGFNTEFCDTAWNFSEDEELELSNSGLEWGWITGHNSMGHTQFAERFESAGTFQINGVFLDVAKASSLIPLAHIELKVWKGEKSPEKEVYSQLVFIDDLQANSINYVPIDPSLAMSGTFFIGYKIYYNAIVDTFAVYHTKNRGYTRTSSMYFYDGTWLGAKNANILPISTSLGIGISECYGKTKIPANNVVNVFPNPCSSSLKMDIPDNATVYDVKCYDNTGRQVVVSLNQNEDGNKLYFNLDPGIYNLKIITDKSPFFARFMVAQKK